MEKKNKITLLAIQLGSEIADIKKNIEKAENLLVKNLSQKPADFVFLPEVWTVGWDCPSFAGCGEEINTADSVNMLKKMAIKYNTNIIGGSFIEKKSDGKLYNTMPVINREGTLVGTYCKNHLYSYYGCDEGSYIQYGNNPVMVNLDGLNIGLTICYDIRFPEIYREYRKSGADLFINAAAWGESKRTAWDTMTKSRAIENQTYMVALTQTGTLKSGENNLGHSMIIDYQGNILNEIEKIEDGIYADIDLNSMYEFRNKCTILKDIHPSYEVKIL